MEFITTLQKEFTKLRAFRAHVPYVPTCLRALCAYMPYVSSRLKLVRAYVPTCSHFLRACASTCLRAYIYFSCLRAFVS